MDCYYKTEIISENTWLIIDKKGVGMYLLAGSEKALLIDTGYGNEELPALIKSLTQKPLMVVNTHIHPDHVGGNYLFSEVYAHAEDIPKEGELPEFEAMTKTVMEAMGTKRSLKNSMLRKMIGGFTYKKAENPPLPLPAEDIDLGRRVIKVFPCPGHTPGSVMFLDPKTKTVFAGDSLGIWLFTNPAQSLDGYIANLEKAAALPGYEHLWMSHVPKVRRFDLIKDFIVFLQKSKTKKTKKIMLPGFPSPLLMYDKIDKNHGYLSAWYFKSQQ